jgi:hypothetical protein
MNAQVPSRPSKQVLTVAADAQGQVKRHGEWFRGEHTNFNPTKADMASELSVYNNVLKGWMPDEAMIGPSTQITAFGSCFAFNISNWLSKRNYKVLTRDEEHKDAYVIRMGEGMVNTFVIRQQFEWAWDEREFDQTLWHGYDASEFSYDDKAKAQQRAIFDTTDVFILTFGLSEVWYDDETGEVFSRTIPKNTYDPARHKFRVSSVEENRDNMQAIYDMIRKHRPDAKIIFTLSPVPLSATFRDNSCLTSNSVSKAILRVAVDEMVRANKEEGVLFYWPSYEIVTDVFHLPYKDDRRHVERPVLDYIMTEFEHHWCKSADVPPPPLSTAWVTACASAGLLPPRLENICKKRDVQKLEEFMQRQKFSLDSDTDLNIRAMLGRLPDEWAAEEAAKAQNAQAAELAA